MLSPGGYDGVTTVGGPKFGPTAIDTFEFTTGPKWEDWICSTHKDSTNREKNRLQNDNKAYLQALSYLHDQFAVLTDPDDSTFNADGKIALITNYRIIRDRVLPELENANFGISKPINEKSSRKNVRDVLINFMRKYFSDVDSSGPVFEIFLEIFDDLVRHAYLEREYRYCMPKQDPAFKSVYDSFLKRRKPINEILRELLDVNKDLFEQSRDAGRRIFRTLAKKK